MLKAVKRLLHDEGLTIKGVQRLHREQGLKAIAGFSDEEAAFTPAPESESHETAVAAGPDTVRLRAILADLEAARVRLDQALGR